VKRTAYVVVFASLSLLAGGVAQARLPSSQAQLKAKSATPGYFNFALIGDFGTGGAEQKAVAKRMCKWRAYHPFQDVFTAGDNVYDDGAKERFEARFFEPYSCLLDAGVMWHAVLGNHDIIANDGADELAEPSFGMKARNYVVRRNLVRFVMMDSNAVRMRWVKRHLRSEAGERWLVVVLHHPIYSPGTAHGSTPGFKKMFNRLFRRRGVDLVVSGHDHIYSVSKPIKKIRYLVTGGGGRNLYPCGEATYSAVCMPRHHFVYVHAGRTRLRVRAVPPKGPMFHRFLTQGRP
jgi:hypothetical protein